MKLLVLLTATTLVFASGDYSNRRAPGFSLADSHYQQHDPQDYRGKVLVLDIMTTTCPTCMKLAETLVAVKAKYGDKVGMLSIVTLPDNFDTADKFAKEYKITWPIVFDSGQVIMSYLKVTPSNPQVHFPHLFIVDGNGTIRDDFEGSEDKALTVDALSAEIEKLQTATMRAQR
jgi:peroxiredoxin